MSAKPKLAWYWAASCGGCDISTLAIDDKVLQVAEAFDIVFWPCVMDGKTSDVEAIEDGGIAVTLWNGAIRSSEHEHMAKLLRRKSRALVAFGSCAQEGCIPGLANDTTRDAIFAAAYLDSPSTANPQRVLPRTETDVPEGRLSLPAFYETVKTLDQTVPVDAYLPGCPPEAERIWDALQALMSGAAIPPGGGHRRADDGVRRLQAHAEREEDRGHQADLAGHPRPGDVPHGAGAPVRGDRDPRRLRGPLPRRQLAVHRLLRPERRGRGLRRTIPVGRRLGPRRRHAGGRRPHHPGRHPGPGRHVLPLQPARQPAAARGAEVTSMNRITIDPVTRLEGHGKIEIFLDPEGEVENAYFQVPELRGFERFCVGRLAEDMPNITDRICGVCPEAHHIAATKALDALFHVDPPPAAKKLRELFYSIFFATDHTTHFYALSGPDFVMGPDAPKAERNILGVIQKVGMDVAGRVLKMRRDGHDLIAMIGGRRVQPNWGLPGGVSRGITEAQRLEILERGKEAVEFARFSLKLFDSIVLGNPVYVEMIQSDGYTHRTYDMGMVDEKNRVNFYDGMIRVKDPEGREAFKYHAKDYLEYVEERVEPWTYLKFPYLKKVGWKGLVDGKDSGVYKATPLSRLNASDGMATPLAQEEYERMYATLGGKPVHHTLATHWARLVELLYATERWVELGLRPGGGRPGRPRPAEGEAGRGHRLRGGACAAPSPTTTGPTSAG